jgi:hypothetical protein
MSVPASYGKSLKIIVLANMAILCCVFFILSGVHYFDYSDLAKSGVRAQGKIMELRCSQHSTFTYKFQLEDHRIIEGLGNGGYGNPNCNTLKIGDAIEVYYLEKNPSVHIDGNPGQRREDEKSSMVLAGILMPLFLLAVFRYVKF